MGEDDGSGRRTLAAYLKMKLVENKIFSLSFHVRWGMMSMAVYRKISSEEYTSDGPIWRELRIDETDYSDTLL